MVAYIRKVVSWNLFVQLTVDVDPLVSICTKRQESVFPESYTVLNNIHSQPICPGVQDEEKLKNLFVAASDQQRNDRHFAMSNFILLIIYDFQLPLGHS